VIPQRRTLSLLSALAFVMTAPVPASQISVQNATYGASCCIQADNAGASVKTLCDGAEQCGYAVNFRALGDPKPGCKKDFVVHYICKGGALARTATAPAEAGSGSIAPLDCSATAAPAPTVPPVKAAPSAPASDAPIGFEANGTCVGSCPPARPLQPGEQKGGTISFETKLPNGDRFAFTGQPSSTSQVSFGQAQFGYDSPIAIQYLGNASDGPSQDDTITTTYYRAFAVGHDGQIDIKPTHWTAMSLGLAEGSSAEAGLSGTKGERWIATYRWPAPPRSQQNPVTGAFHYTVGIRDGVLNIWFRFGAHFAAGSLPGSFIDFNGATPPLLTFAQLRRGEGFTAPPDVACPAGTPADQALERAKRAAARSANIMTVRCLLLAADSGDAGAANDVGYAAEHGLAVLPNAEEAASWYRKAAEQGNSQAQDRLAHILATGPAATHDVDVAKHWTQRATSLRQIRSSVCNAPSIINGMHQADLEVERDPETQMGKVVALGGGIVLQYTLRSPFLVKVVDTSFRYGQFQLDPLRQGGDFLRQGFFTRGDDKAVPLLGKNDIDRLREARDAEVYGSRAWQAADSAIDIAETAEALTEFMNQQWKAHDIYVQYYVVGPLGGRRYRITPINTTVTRTHSVDVDGPALDAPR
jgi:Sel1 repeat